MKLSILKFDKRRGTILAVALTVLAICAVAGVFFGDTPEPTVPSREMANDPVVQAYVQAMEQVEENYGITPDKERLMRGAVLGMLHSLDPHSGFFDRREFSEMQD